MNFINRIVKTTKKDIFVAVTASLIATPIIAILIFFARQLRENIYFIAPVADYILSIFTFLLIYFYFYS